MNNVAIIANGPPQLIPDLDQYKDVIDVWIGADRGAYIIAKQQLPLHFAVGDFDSMRTEEKLYVKSLAKTFLEYPVEKDETDLEIALRKAFQLQPDTIYLFGVTGGRLDHELVNIQLLHKIVEKGVKGKIVDKQNKIQLMKPGTYSVYDDKHYPNISFLPFSNVVEKLTLDGFYYSLTSKNISWGDSLCVSNKLLSKRGTFSFQAGILLLIKSSDVLLR